MLTQYLILVLRLSSMSVSDRLFGWLNVSKQSLSYIMINMLHRTAHFFVYPLILSYGSNRFFWSATGDCSFFELVIRRCVIKSYNVSEKVCIIE